MDKVCLFYRTSPTISAAMATFPILSSPIQIVLLLWNLACWTQTRRMTRACPWPAERWVDVKVIGLEVICPYNMSEDTTVPGFSICQKFMTHNDKPMGEAVTNVMRFFFLPEASFGLRVLSLFSHWLKHCRTWFVWFDAKRNQWDML